MREKPIYSFYDGSSRSERLRCHVELALQVFDDRSRLVRYGVGLKKSFHKLLEYAIILHDFGKVPFNQKFYESREKKSSKLSFEGHEIISAWFADKFLKRAEDDRIIEDGDRSFVFLAILLHHHPMDLRSRADKLEKMDMRLNKETIELFYDELDGIIQPKYEILRDKEEVSVRDIVGQVLGERGILHSTWSTLWMNGDPLTRRVFLALIQGLIAADYSSAGTTRGGVSEFSTVIQLYLTYYGINTSNSSPREPVQTTTP
ncbi:MAG: CRISPR-associated endonuclease Cas3'' [Sulfolobales archaeon]